jgi:hypothetical protein
MRSVPKLYKNCGRRGCDKATLFVVYINTGIWPSRLGESRIWDSKIWSWVPRDSDPRMTVLARTSSGYKRQTRPLIREGPPHQQTRNCRRVTRIWSWALNGAWHRDFWVGEYGAVSGMRIGKGNRSTRRKPTPVTLHPPEIPHDNLGPNPGRRGGKPATNFLSYRGRVARLLESWDSNIGVWVQRDSEPRRILLARASSNLPNRVGESPLVVRCEMVASRKRHTCTHESRRISIVGNHNRSTAGEDRAWENATHATVSIVRELVRVL